MGWKEIWERYQMAAAFAEAGEETMARQFLEEVSTESPSPVKEGRSYDISGEGLMDPSPAKS